MSAKERERKELSRHIEELLSDPLVSKLVETSSLTRIQLKTVMINLIFRNNARKRGEGDLKLALRARRGRITRGAFNRTLRQGRNNIQESICTVLLMGYVGYFDSPELLPFLELSDQLRALRQEASQGQRSEWMMEKVMEAMEKISQGRAFQQV